MIWNQFSMLEEEEPQKKSENLKVSIDFKGKK